MASSEGSTSGFPPVVGAQARVLILGTLPSRRSLELSQYYGHPRNAFWRIMGVLFGAGPEVPYAERTRRVAAAGVAIWDVLAASVRPGSMDAAIDLATASANDIEGFLGSHPYIRLVCFNGRTAESLFRRLVAPNLEKGSNVPRYETLPSTSPAFAAMSFEEKLERWKVILAETNKKGESA
jgi:hypoxanthine-DNA glycosylase